MAEQAPSVGRTVHFHASRNGEKFSYAAIITNVREGGNVDLVTFGVQSLYFNANIPFAEGNETDGTWGWPPRV